MNHCGSGGDGATTFDRLGVLEYDVAAEELFAARG
jgi:hypothetical protein